MCCYEDGFYQTVLATISKIPGRMYGLIAASAFFSAQDDVSLTRKQARDLEMFIREIYIIQLLLT
jgi:hypothetical protein